MRPAFGVLGRSRPFARLFSARALSLLGDGVGSLALIVHVQQDEGTGTAVGLLLLAAALPRLLSPLAGAVADRTDQRTVLASAELAQGVLMGVAALWLPPLPVLLVLLLGKSVAATVADPAGRSAVPALVEDSDLPAANSLLGALREGGEVLGPLIGGLVVAAGGVRAALAVDALTFLVSVPLLLRLPSVPPERDERNLAGAAWDGLRYTATHPVARVLALVFLLVGLSAADDVAVPFLARELGAGPRGIGALYAALGAGLVLAYLVQAAWRRPVPPAAAFVAGIAVAGLGNVLTGMAPVLVAAVAAQTVRGVGLAVLETNLQTLAQRGVPRAMLGRVFANVYGAVNLGAAVSLLAGGVLVDATSPRTVLVLAGALGMATAVVAVTTLPRLRTVGGDDG